MPLRRLCNKSELASGNVKRIEDLDLALFNLHGTFFAIKDVCTHDQAPLSEGELIGDTIVCPWHGACFSVRTGEALSLPAIEPVETFPVIVQGDDVYVDI
jgi:3-phenylpropionate/trans-cinnamate dioxygenase ferredoxin component